MSTVRSEAADRGQDQPSASVRDAAAGWHVRGPGGRAGPVSLDAVKAMIAERRIGATSLLWHPSMGAWEPAWRVPAVAWMLGYTVAGVPPTRPPLREEPVARRPDFATAMLVPVGRSGWAIAAGYCGLFSPFFAIPLAPLAVLFGVMAVRDIRKHPEKLGMVRAVFGMAMGIVVMLGVVGVAVYLATNP